MSGLLRGVAILLRHVLENMHPFHTREPQKVKKGNRALIDAEVETSTSVFKNLLKNGCVCREELVDKAEE